MRIFAGVPLGGGLKR